ncbi:MAG: toxin-antitoxin system HicB family antitoxin [Gammaproteobacteria bacterium]|nr:toxin-antitoxin system HicB family antitoxin [Gammaproteobacteria bacterium]
MSTLSIRLPDSLHKAVKQVAKEDHSSINQFITMAVTERVSALALSKRLDREALRISKDDYMSVLKKVPSRKPVAEDSLIA